MRRFALLLIALLSYSPLATASSLHWDITGQQKASFTLYIINEDLGSPHGVVENYQSGSSIPLEVTSGSVDFDTVSNILEINLNYTLLGGYTFSPNILDSQGRYLFVDVLQAGMTGSMLIREDFSHNSHVSVDYDSVTNNLKLFNGVTLPQTSTTIDKWSASGELFTSSDPPPTELSIIRQADGSFVLWMTPLQKRNLNSPFYFEAESRFELDARLASVPEPASLLLLSSGVLLLRRRRS